MKCITCKRTVENGFDIFMEDAETEATITHDLEEILGADILHHLHPNDHVCSICKKMLDDIAKIKRILLQTILNKKHLKFPVNYGRYWEFISRITPGYLQKDILINPPFTPSLTPNSNGYLPHFSEYDVDFKMDRFNRKRAPSARSLASRDGNDLTNAEVARLMHRPRGRPKSAPNNKNSQKVLNQIRRVRSENVFLDNDEFTKEFDYKLPDLKFDENGKLMNIETRAISRLAEFYCPHCYEYEHNLRKYTSHMVQKHGYEAYYECSTCNTYYLSKAHLKFHERIHDNSFPICPICGNSQTNIEELQEHTNRHIVYSIPCLYCDLAFLSKKEYHNHILERHRGKKRKIENRKKHRIIEKIIYVDIDKNNKTQGSNITGVKEYDNFIYEKKPVFKPKKKLDLSLDRRSLTPTFEPFCTSLGDDLYAIEKQFDNNDDSDNDERNCVHNPLDENDKNERIQENSNEIFNSDTSESEVDFENARISSKKNKLLNMDSSGAISRTNCLNDIEDTDIEESSPEVRLDQQFINITSEDSNISVILNNKDEMQIANGHEKNLRGDEWLHISRTNTPNSQDSLESETQYSEKSNTSQLLMNHDIHNNIGEFNDFPR